MPRTSNSTAVPTFLVAALGSLRQASTAQAAGSATSNPKACKSDSPKAAPLVRKASVAMLPVEAITQRKLIAHGAGVFEDPNDQSIWYREGQFLRRRAMDVDRILRDYVAGIK